MENYNYKVDMQVSSYKNLYVSNLLKVKEKNETIEEEYCNIVLVKNSKYIDETIDFLISVAEPKCRTQNFHEYNLTKSSLYAAASMNILSEDIIKVLKNMCKHELPKGVEDFIYKCSKTKGKAKLLLQNNKYYIECVDEEYKNLILNKSNSEIYESWETAKKRQENNKTDLKKFKEKKQIDSIMSCIDSLYIRHSNFEDEEESIINPKTTFEIDGKSVDKIKKYCLDKGFPLLEEYDFKNDKKNLNLEIQTNLKNSVRPYQEKALSIMFKRKRARSGIIVLPCGAGKTLVGILATVTIKKNTVVLCNSAASVEQWYNEYKNWTNIDPNCIFRLTSKYNEKSEEKFWNSEMKAGVLIATYSMITYTGKRNPFSEKVIEKIKAMEWGLLILDEVHILPADNFSKTSQIIKAHCKLGLTATLVREDLKIKNLQYLVGPKHYEADWAELQKDGYLARVQCIEILIEMHSKFYKEYLNRLLNRNSNDYYMINPFKLKICKALIKHHENEKIIIFCDNIKTLKIFQRELNIKDVIHGDIGNKEREIIIKNFKETNKCNVIIMSKVGDTSLDIPNASVLIQVSSHGGSRRQEAQRLGRILRPKSDCISEYNAYFYSVVSKNTKEMYFNQRRREFLINQGFSFKVVTSLEELNINYDSNQDEFNYDLIYNDFVKSDSKFKDNEDNNDSEYDGFSSEDEMKKKKK